MREIRRGHAEGLGARRHPEPGANEPGVQLRPLAADERTAVAPSRRERAVKTVEAVQALHDTLAAVVATAAVLPRPVTNFIEGV